MVRKAVNQAKNSFWERKCNEINRLMGSSRSRESWKTINGLRQNTRTTKRFEQIGLSQWKEYYKELLTEKRDVYKEVKYATEQVTEHVDDFTIEEVTHAIKIMKNNRSPGPGGVLIELVK